MKEYFTYWDLVEFGLEESFINCIGIDDNNERLMVLETVEKDGSEEKNVLMSVCSHDRKTAYGNEVHVEEGSEVWELLGRGGSI